jgi:hypothetical protein
MPSVALAPVMLTVALAAGGALMAGVVLAGVQPAASPRRRRYLRIIISGGPRSSD